MTWIMRKNGVLKIIMMLAVTVIVSLIAVRRDPSLAETGHEVHLENEAHHVTGEALQHLRSERSEG